MQQQTFAASRPRSRAWGYLFRPRCRINGARSQWGAAPGARGVGGPSSFLRRRVAFFLSHRGDRLNILRLTLALAALLAAGTAQGATQISCGNAHCLALADDGSVKAWGGNTSGETTVPGSVDAAGEATFIAAGAHTSCAIDSTGAVRCWGLNADGQASPPSSGAFCAAARGESSEAQRRRVRARPARRCRARGRGASRRIGSRSLDRC